MTRYRKPSSQALRLLAALRQKPEAWRHGYELSRTTGLKAGSLYPLLRRLAQRGVLQARWEDASQAGRPPRHSYRLSLNCAIDAPTEPAGKFP